MTGEHTIYQPFYGPQGQPYAVEIDGKIVSHHWEEREAWDRRDEGLVAGHVHVRVLGAPCRGLAVVPESPPLNIIDDGDISLPIDPI